MGLNTLLKTLNSAQTYYVNNFAKKVFPIWLILSVPFYIFSLYIRSLVPTIGMLSILEFPLAFQVLLEFKEITNKNPVIQILKIMCGLIGIYITLPAILHFYTSLSALLTLIPLSLLFSTFQMYSNLYMLIHTAVHTNRVIDGLRQLTNHTFDAIDSTTNPEPSAKPTYSKNTARWYDRANFTNTLYSALEFFQN